MNGQTAENISDEGDSLDITVIEGSQQDNAGLTLEGLRDKLDQGAETHNHLGDGTPNANEITEYRRLCKVYDIYLMNQLRYVSDEQRKAAFDAVENLAGAVQYRMAHGTYERTKDIEIDLVMNVAMNRPEKLDLVLEVIKKGYKRIDEDGNEQFDGWIHINNGLEIGARYDIVDCLPPQFRRLIKYGSFFEPEEDPFAPWWKVKGDKFSRFYDIVAEKQPEMLPLLEHVVAENGIGIRDNVDMLANQLGLGCCIPQAPVIHLSKRAT